MGNDNQGSCFCVIGIIILVMTFVIWFSFFFVIIGIGFIMGSICLSQQKVKRASISSPTPNYQARSAVQQPTSATNAPIPKQEPPKPAIKEPESHKFCPYCGSPATEIVCQICGSKID